MLSNVIDWSTAECHEFLTHEIHVKSIGPFLAVDFGINKDIYFEMELSSRHNDFNPSIHGRNIEMMENFFATMGVFPNPDFVFFPKPIDNERYLIHRFIKSIFQIPNNNLYLFSNDSEFQSFCNSNQLEYVQQKWFKRVYIRDSYSKARAYLLKCSLLFQELYFPPNSAITRFNITLHDVNILKQTVPFKPDFEQIFEILKRNKISKLYHFTDRKNLDSIKKYGLLSAEEVNRQGVYPRYASSESSRARDSRMGISDYVRLSFVKNHPMMFTAMTAYGLNPIILEINPLIALMPKVFFSDKNTLRTGAQIGPSASDLEKVKFDVIQANKAYYELSDLMAKDAYQAEVLIKKRIGPEMILNIDKI